MKKSIYLEGNVTSVVIWGKPIMSNHSTTLPNFESMATLDMTIRLREKLGGLFTVWKMFPIKSILWAQHKILWVDGGTISIKSTGLANHFKDGCPFDTGKEKSTLVFTLIDFYDTTKEKLERAGHVPGPYCQCKECGHLKDLEDRWILKMGTFYGSSGLNSRDDAKNKTICHRKWISPMSALKNKKGWG